MAKNNDDQMWIPGLEPVEELDEFHVGSPSSTKNYFDASMLPDAPGRQKNAANAQTYVLHIVLPTFEDLKKTLLILSGGDRKGLPPSAALATLSGTAKKKGTDKTLMEFWEEKITDENQA